MDFGSALIEISRKDKFINISSFNVPFLGQTTSCMHLGENAFNSISGMHCLPGNWPIQNLLWYANFEWCSRIISSSNLQGGCVWREAEVAPPLHPRDESDNESDWLISGGNTYPMIPGSGVKCTNHRCAVVYSAKSPIPENQLLYVPPHIASTLMVTW